MKGFEPPTPSLPWKCSTPELHRQCISILPTATPLSIMNVNTKLQKDELFQVHPLKSERVMRLEPTTLSLEG